MAKMKGLGRGLDALLGGEAPTAPDTPRELDIGLLQPGKYQPRAHMDAASLAELAASIKAQGIMQPILVRPLASGQYEIIAGERRWRAAQMAGLKQVPVLVRDVPDEAALAMALIENIQREDLNPIEEAQGIQRLIEEFGMTHEDAAEAVGRSRSAVSNLLRLRQLPQTVQDMVLAGTLDMGHARALLPLPAAQQITVAHEVAAKGLSVRETEKRVARLLKPVRKGTLPESDRDIQRLEQELSERLGATVRIRHGRKGAGRLTIDYATLDQLDAILARLGGA
ncbi:ParB/RepB/Spo0J family partition protein [Thiobacter aerophilum]|uniref:ParB/RepB/Spo0J family partition protein n=1 Tax=Thiobacter aerophilum TaxID=3121275 RepID=A0ABV0EFD0_9BURK